MMSAPDVFILNAAALSALLLREMLGLAAVGLLISGIDDLFVDVVFFARRLTKRRHPRACADDMTSPTAGWMAIVVPAWDESAVIGAMLARISATLDYPRWRVFVGVYPNDPATREAINAVGEPRIEIVQITRPGPTTKADCLNHLWRAVVAHEAVHGLRFKAIVLHDAEDVVHRRELAVFDQLIPRLALVQLPVEPFIDRQSRWVAGHYLDEFAESHAKDIVVREALGAAVPSAGVACAIERGMLARIAAERGGAPFDPACFTEDYELGLRVKRLGGRGALVRIRDTRGVLVATREYFPATFRAAVRQKSRWMLGIALAGWDRMGWQGGAAERYMLWRDRKPLFSAPLLVLAYLSLAGGLAVALLRATWPAAAGLPAIAPEGGTLALLLAINGGLLAWRLAMRALFTARAHGLREGARAVPRALVANLINLVATARALRRYLAIILGGRAVTWEKTAHRFPAVPAG